MNNNTQNKLANLRKEMKALGINACIIPSCDCHNSEYINDCFKYRAYYSGFTGSAGTLYVTHDKSFLITDGRYFLQAENQLRDTEITLVKDGIDGEPDIYKLIENTLSKGMTLFTDGRLTTQSMYEKIVDIANKIGFCVSIDESPVVKAASDMPKQNFSKVKALDISLTGKDSADKIADIRDELKKYGAECHIITSLEEIAWILNMRATDIKNTPVFYAYMIITLTEAVVFADTCAMINVNNELDSAGVTLMPYSDFYDHLKKGSYNNVLCDKNQVNALAVSCLKNANIINKCDPAMLAKAVKNETEIENLRKVHLFDGLAVARFMHYIKNCNIVNETEISAAEKLRIIREKCKDYLGDSFDTISAYGENGAVIHYSPASETNTSLSDKGALLVDSGGQYIGGTTDITRVFVLGETTEEFKIHYTAVCKAMLRLQSAIFKKGTKCAVLDMLARGPLWEMGLDYRHGTGHGIGYMLSVHEGPNRFHYANTSPSLLPGMVTSDEPGMYEAEKHGIRIENEILCVDKFSTEYGEFLGFEPLTVCPIDTDAIIPELLDKSDIKALNEYHSFVYDSLKEIAEPEELLWLSEYTKPI